ncbi:hypothetical protein [Streptomyces flavofungini]|uniref:hypothetical protein n=1 Tax=Streptomyces flavofungini TaxID=68200 RepID=UPI0025AF7D91|nr:hypothetical protein [Streptomyces flavofungini]WJV46960.1 hypothetical protein QUY26_16355 [Streptomyces flavofungini]
MQLRHAFHLHSESVRSRALVRAFGRARFVFDDAAHACCDAHTENFPYASLDLLFPALTAEAKGQLERVWIAEDSSVLLRKSLRGAESAYRNFFAWSRRFASVPSEATVVRDGAVRIFASFGIEPSPSLTRTACAPPGTQPGTDIGLTRFAVLSGGMKIDRHRFLRRVEKALKKAQRELPRREKEPRTGPWPA